jgi:membrane associated rhomboid family serine protease
MDKSLKTVPLCKLLAVSLVTVFSLYSSSALKSIPCGKDFVSKIFSNFVHFDLTHLVTNLFALYSLSRVEKDIKSKRFCSLIVFLVVFTSIAEVIAHKLNNNLKCSIGFSGILFGITTWELVTKNKIDFYLITSIISMVVIPSLQNNDIISFSSHIIGAISGVIGGLIWNKIGHLFN